MKVSLRNATKEHMKKKKKQYQDCYSVFQKQSYAEPKANYFHKDNKVF